MADIDLDLITTYKILILEDDLNVLSGIFNLLDNIEDKVNTCGYIGISPTVVSEDYYVKEIFNKNQFKYDLIILDRNSAGRESFHCLDFKKYPLSKIILISSTQRYYDIYKDENKELGESEVVRKDYDDIDEFFKKLEKAILERVQFGRIVMSKNLKNRNIKMQWKLNSLSSIQNRLFELDIKMPSTLLFYHHNRSSPSSSGEIESYLGYLVEWFIKVYRDIGSDIDFSLEQSDYTKSEQSILKERMYELIYDYSKITKKVIKTINIILNNFSISNSLFLSIVDKSYKKFAFSKEFSTFGTFQRAELELYRMSNSFSSEMGHVYH